ncbi:MAG: SUF system NifU family Fe-S cluster assembly protein [Erysipelotrichia bacterium]|nr:SUF system NifU family Fe-S cluster assembly protein [Erysipelotrichia bacterium]
MNEMLKDPMVLRSIIMDHYEYPRNHELKEDESYLKKHMASESCIDDIHVQAKICDGKIEDVCFDGVACTIATSSTSIMSELMINKTIEEARKINEEYRKMIDKKEYDEDLLEEAVAFQNVGNQANRIHCATIGWDAMMALIDESEEK